MNLQTSRANAFNATSHHISAAWTFNRHEHFCSSRWRLSNLLVKILKHSSSSILLALLLLPPPSLAVHLIPSDCVISVGFGHHTEVQVLQPRQLRQDVLPVASLLDHGVAVQRQVLQVSQIAQFVDLLHLVDTVPMEVEKLDAGITADLLRAMNRKQTELEKEMVIMARQSPASQAEWHQHGDNVSALRWQTERQTHKHTTKQRPYDIWTLAFTVKDSVKNWSVIWMGKSWKERWKLEYSKWACRIFGQIDNLKMTLGTNLTTLMCKQHPFLWVEKEDKKETYSTIQWNKMQLHMYTFQS